MVKACGINERLKARVFSQGISALPEAVPNLNGYTTSIAIFEEPLVQTVNYNICDYVSALFECSQNDPKGMNAAINACIDIVPAVAEGDLDGAKTKAFLGTVLQACPNDEKLLSRLVDAMTALLPSANKKGAAFTQSLVSLLDEACSKNEGVAKIRGGFIASAKSILETANSGLEMLANEARARLGAPQRDGGEARPV
jgi:hypothetical protein